MGKMSIVKVFSSVVIASFISMSGFSTVANGQDLESWQQEIGKAVAKKQVYPRAALRKELQGMAKVEINVDSEGNILTHTLTSSTGHDLLDSEVPKLISRVSPLPAPPASVSDSQLTMTIPLAWVLE